MSICCKANLNETEVAFGSIYIDWNCVTFHWRFWNISLTFMNYSKNINFTIEMFHSFELNFRNFVLDYLQFEQVS